MNDGTQGTVGQDRLALSMAALVQAHVEGLENGGTDEHLAKVHGLKTDMYDAAAALVTVPLAPVKTCREDLQSLALELYAGTLVETGRLILEAGEHALKRAGEMQRAAGFGAIAPDADPEPDAPDAPEKLN